MCVVHLRFDCSAMPRYWWCVSGPTGIYALHCVGVYDWLFLSVGACKV